MRKTLLLLFLLLLSCVRFPVPVEYAGTAKGPIILLSPQKDYYLPDEPVFLTISNVQDWERVFVCRDGRLFPRREISNNSIPTNFRIPGLYRIGVYGMDAAGHASPIHSLWLSVSNTNVFLLRVFDFENWRGAQCEGWTNGSEYREAPFARVALSRDSLFGRYAAAFTVSPNGLQAFWFQKELPLRAGRLLLSFSAKSLDLFPRVKMVLKFFRNGNYLGSAESDMIVPGTNWQRYAAVLSIPSGADKGILLVESYGSSYYYGTFLLDRLVVSEKRDSTPPRIADWEKPEDGEVISGGVLPLVLTLSDDSAFLYLNGTVGEQRFRFPVTNSLPFSTELVVSNISGETQTLKIWPEDAAGNIGATNTRRVIFSRPDEVLTVFDFEGQTNAPIIVASGLSVGVFECSPALLYYLAGNTPSSYKSVAAKGWTTADAFFDFELESSHEIELKSLEFDERASSTGPAHWRVEVSQQGSVLWSDEGDTSAVFRAFPMHSLVFTNLRVSGAVRIRWYGTGALSSRGSWRLDNIRLKGVLRATNL